MYTCNHGFASECLKREFRSHSGVGKSLLKVGKKNIFKNITRRRFIRYNSGLLLRIYYIAERNSNCYLLSNCTHIPPYVTYDILLLLKKKKIVKIK